MDWDALFETHVDAVLRICWRITGRQTDVEDCVQETFLQAFQWHQREHVRNWAGALRRIAVTSSLACLRRRVDIDPIEENRDPESPEEIPAETAMRRELEGRLRQAVAGLPDREATVFCLRYFESQTTEETAHLLKIPNGAVAAALHRARRKLERELAELLEPF